MSGIHVNRFFLPGQWRTIKNPTPIKHLFTICRYVFPFAISSPTNINHFLLPQTEDFSEVWSSRWSSCWQFYVSSHSPYGLKKSIPKRSLQRKEKGKRSNIYVHRMFLLSFMLLYVGNHALFLTVEIMWELK